MATVSREPRISLLAERLREHRKSILGSMGAPMCAEQYKRLAADLALAAAMAESDVQQLGAVDLTLARRAGVGHVMRTLCNAADQGGCSATWLAETLGYPVADLYDDGLQRVANMTTYAAEGEAKE